MIGILILSAVVFTMNVIPAFAPPTWMVFSIFGAKFPDHSIVAFAVCGALAATLGRVLLAKGSQAIIRGRFLSPAAAKSIDAIREHMQSHSKATISFSLLYAFTPLPSNYVFIAYGLTKMRLKLLAIPFFLGRSVTYSFWTFTGSTLARKVSIGFKEGMSYLGVYFIISQIVLIALLVAFTRVDWRALLDQKKFRWLSAEQKIAGQIEKM